MRRSGNLSGLSFVPGGAAAVLLLCLVCSCQQTSETLPANKKSDSNGATPQTITLTIVYPGDRPRFEYKPDWTSGLTVFDLLNRAADAGDGGLEIRSRGAGETAFVEAIGGVVNEGADGDNWIYVVNEQLADKGAGVYELSPGDQVLWKYGDYP